MPDGINLVLSVVSHGQRELLLSLLDDLQTHVKTPFQIIVTENIREEPDFPIGAYSFPVEIVRNTHPKGFGANHNAAMKQVMHGFFCVLNPDIRLLGDPFPTLLALASDRRFGVVAPVVVNPDLIREDHARSFPSVFSLVGKLFGYRPPTGMPAHNNISHPDWVAGMFMLFRTQTLHAMGGFDERYYLYYEDVDLCARLRDQGLDVAVCGDASVIHAARRQSRRSVRFAAWHIRSGLRFLASRPRIALGLRARR